MKPLFDLRQSLTIAALGVGAAIVLASGHAAWAQVPSVGQGTGTTAAPLPLSGRAGQNGSVVATESPIPGVTSSVNSLNPVIQTQGPYSGSTQSTSALPFSGKLSLRDAVRRALQYNLGTTVVTQAERQARGQLADARSALMPNINGSLSEAVQQTNLRAQGLRIDSPIPGFGIPSIAGPFNYFDLRAHLTDSIVNFTERNNYHAALETEHAAGLFAQDARELVTLAVGGAYLQVVSAAARVDSAQAQFEAANALYQQSVERQRVGLIAQIDVDRNQVQALTQQQRVISLQNDLAKQKINLARISGLPPNEHYEITDKVPFAAEPPVSEEEAVTTALAHRMDVSAARTQILAAEHALTAARDERLPSLSVNADYGVIGLNPAQSHGTFSVSGTVRIPIWQGGRTAGDVEQATAALLQRQAELDDVLGRVEADARNAFLDLQAAANQVQLARTNLDVSRQILTLTQQRFETGVTDSLDVAQSQAAVAAAELDYIDSVFAHNIAKLSLARATGNAAENLPLFLKLD